MKKITLLFLLFSTQIIFAQFNAADVKYFVGTGNKTAYLVVDFNDDYEPNSYVWGYRFNDTNLTMEDLEKGYKVYSLLYGWGKIKNPYENNHLPYYDFSVFFENIGIKFYDFYGYEVDGEGIGDMRVNKFRDLYWDNPEIIIPEISDKNNNFLWLYCRNVRCGIRISL